MRSQLHVDPGGAAQQPASEVTGEPGPFTAGVRWVFVPVRAGYVVALNNLGQNYVIAVTGGQLPPLRLGQRNDGLGPRGHPRLPAGRNGATSVQQMRAAPRLAARNTYS